jgi:putative ABC transport system ATP-binding protein
MTAPTAAPPTIAARTVDATKVYGKGDTEVRALDGVTVEFPAHVFTAIMGPSGSGTSTLMQCVAGLDTLTAGQVFVGDADLSRLSEKQLTQLRRDKIGFVFQAFNLVPTLTAAENITLPMDLAGRKPDQAWLDQVVATVGLTDRLHHRPSELSGGQQQRVAVARALASRPEIIFGVKDMGQTVVMVTHDPVAASYADQVLFLADGRIVDRIEAPTADAVLDRIKQFGR